MSSDIRICFIGDSFINGTGDEAALGWAGRLCAQANTRDVQITYYNLGIRRDTSRDILQRWQAETSRRLPDSADVRIVFSFGVNDTVMEDGQTRIAHLHSVANLRQILQESNAYPVLMIGPPPVSDDAQSERIRLLSDAYAQTAESLAVPYIEIFRPLIDDTHYLREIAGNDGSHPQGVGYGKIAGIISASPLWWFNR
jgi:lysophospholipase L1-like esterase